MDSYARTRQALSFSVIAFFLLYFFSNGIAYRAGRSLVDVIHISGGKERLVGDNLVTYPGHYL
jgi:hypothetical protein